MVEEINKEVRGQAIGYISAAFGLVAGLAWNEAITALIDTLFPLEKDTLIVKFAYAVIITLVVVILIKVLNKTLKAENK